MMPGAYTIEPDQESFEEGDEIKIAAYLITIPYEAPNFVDLYFVMYGPVA